MVAPSGRVEPLMVDVKELKNDVQSQSDRSPCGEQPSFLLASSLPGPLGRVRRVEQALWLEVRRSQSVRLLPCFSATQVNLDWPGFILVNSIHTSTIRKGEEVTMLVSLTVGKVDAGVAVLLTEDKRLVMSPCIPHLPPMASDEAYVNTLRRSSSLQYYCHPTSTLAPSSTSMSHGISTLSLRRIRSSPHSSAKSTPALAARLLQRPC